MHYRQEPEQHQIYLITRTNPDEENTPEAMLIPFNSEALSKVQRALLKLSDFEIDKTSEEEPPEVTIKIAGLPIHTVHSLEEKQNEVCNISSISCKTNLQIHDPTDESAALQIDTESNRVRFIKRTFNGRFIYSRAIKFDKLMLFVNQPSSIN